MHGFGAALITRQRRAVRRLRLGGQPAHQLQSILPSYCPFYTAYHEMPGNDMSAAMFGIGRQTPRKGVQSPDDSVRQPPEFSPGKPYARSQPVCAPSTTPHWSSPPCVAPPNLPLETRHIELQRTLPKRPLVEPSALSLEKLNRLPQRSGRLLVEEYSRGLFLTGVEF